MISFEPQVGDVYLVPAKTIHAIGAGCLILEIQEPTDFTVQPERFCGEYRLSDEEMYLGLTKAQAVECFDFEKSATPFVVPRIAYTDEGCRIETLIDRENTDCFVINRIKLEGGKAKLSPKDSYGVYVVTEGEGRLLGDDYERALARGDYFFLPYAARDKYSVVGFATVVECY